MDVREDLFDTALERFYEAAAIPEFWPAALGALAEACGGRGAGLTSTLQGQDRPICSAPVEEFAHRYITEGWNAGDARIERGFRLYRRGHRGMITEAHLFTAEEWAGDPLRNELALKYGCSSFGGIVIAEAGADFLPMTIERPAGADSYTPDEIASINRLVARLQPAGSLALRVGLSAAASAAGGIARPGETVLLIGERGNVLHEAPALDGSVTDLAQVRGGWLRCSDAETDRALQAAIGRAVARVPITDRPQTRVPLTRGDGGAPAMATIVPLTRSAQDVFMLARAIVILSNAETRAPAAGSPQDLMRLFRLTAAEARLAARIGGGESLRDAAEAEAITFETARSRLKDVFAKTDVGRQAELMVMIRRLLRS